MLLFCLSPVISVLVEICGFTMGLYFLFVFVFKQLLAALYSCLHIFTDKIFRAHCES